MRLYFLTLVFLNFGGILSSAQKFLCAEQFCQSYLEKYECMPTVEACGVQNETYHGEMFFAGVPCECCRVCLEHLNEGDFCTIGSIDMPPPNVICGPGLTCMKKDKDDEYKCHKMTSTPCNKNQIEFDELEKSGKLGKFMNRPLCNGDGEFGPVRCIPGQSCFCVDKQGNRIFGEAIHTAITQMTMKCECSKLFDGFIKKHKYLKYPFSNARCSSDGNFDALQCIEDRCICVEKATGAPGTDILNSTTIGFRSIPCYDKSIHHESKYLHDCERGLNDILVEMKEAENEGYSILGMNMKPCQPDGLFWPIQEDDENKFCVNNHNKKIGNYVVPKDSKEASNMNCKCARTVQLLKQHKIKLLPECCPNGNFKEIQCREGVCYCVDTDGNQIVKEVAENSKHLLPCYNLVCQ